MNFSQLAKPPITPAEAQKADASLCAQHGGNMSDPAWYREGRVFYCPIGKQFWRVSGMWRDGMYAPLNYDVTKFT